jgi:hypothetical protein
VQLEQLVARRDDRGRGTGIEHHPASHRSRRAPDRPSLWSWNSSSPALQPPRRLRIVSFDRGTLANLRILASRRMIWVGVPLAVPHRSGDIGESAAFQHPIDRCAADLDGAASGDDRRDGASLSRGRRKTAPAPRRRLVKSSGCFTGDVRAPTPSPDFCSVSEALSFPGLCSRTSTIAPTIFGGSDDPCADQPVIITLDNSSYRG